MANCEMGASPLVGLASSSIYCGKIWEEVKAEAGTVL